MNDPSPSGPNGSHDSPHGTSFAGYPGYTSYDETTGYAAPPEQHYGTDNGYFEPSYGVDPLFGTMPGQEQQPAPMYGNGAYDNGATMYDTGTHAAYSPYDTGAHPTTAYGDDTGLHGAGVPDAGGAYGSGAHQAGGYDTGAYDTTAYDTGAYDTGTYDAGAHAGGLYEHTGYASADSGVHPNDPMGAAGHDTGQAGAQWGSGTYSPLDIPAQTGPEWAADADNGHWNHGGQPQMSGDAQGWAPNAGHAYDTGAYDTGAYDLGSFAPEALHDAGHPDATVGQFDAGLHDTGRFGTVGPYGTGLHDTGQFGTGLYDTGQFEAGQYDTGQYDTGRFGVGQYESGSWDLGDYGPGAPVTGHHPSDLADSGSAGSTISGTGEWDTGGWQVSDLAAAGSARQAEQAAQAEQLAAEQQPHLAGVPHLGDQSQPNGHPQGTEREQPADAPDSRAGSVDSDTLGDIPLHELRAHDDGAPFDSSEPGRHTPRDDNAGDWAPDISPDVPASLAGAASRRRRRAAKPRRSALLTVAVPSVAVMGVAGIAAASVGNLGDESKDKGEQAAPDPASVKPSDANSKLDIQLDGVRADAGDFAGRASRTQERLDLKERQEAERKRKEAEAARKEAERPKFALPVTQPGLSAYYGQAGVNWLSLHTGIDFPVSYGTPVKASADGMISTKYDISYGNMIILTTADGTELWYCHLSSSKIRSGPVKAGDTIGYAGSSGNSTGPHLHFEVRPGGGSAIDPLGWFRGKGLDPT
ncbi:peptidoglycan DD-metalloendopeptidase family protein [Streptomyces sp. XM4193]|uniref:M23 family metallopeptidase n=1 Tax=Streptomyces sp. XM4193 TaxID=2929782 RepID=UPI001FFA842D|nr:M23 family metallopeptidase [Streptomyces sp. XM4193]MCK1795520.1 peptidoglycan DD-metalloendopeptidase family protein [Streptomyces sp. XM4193]